VAQPPRPDLAAIREAAARIRPYVHRTPVLTCQALDDLAQARLFFKCENFQKAGAFKARGAANAVWSLDASEARKGVATHSSGNHAAALALAARRRGIPAYIVMPETAPAPKQAAVAGYGGKIILCAPTLAAREEAARRVLAETGAVLVHPYNDHRVMAGQGTAALELLEEVLDLEAVVAPVGGGGLLAGTALAATGLRPGITVVGAEPQAADDAWQSLQEGRIVPSLPPLTIADGLTTSLGELTFPVLRERVEKIVTVAEEAIVSAMRLVWERMKIVVEPSAAVAVAAVLDPTAGLTGRRVGVILSGGNVDLDKLPWVKSGTKPV
jgi:threonine dehydratase